MTVDARARVDDQEMCRRCERIKPKSEFDFDPTTCRPCVTLEIKELTEFRRQTVVGRSAQKLPVADDLLVILDSPAGDTVVRLLDALSGLTASMTPNKAKTLTETRYRPHDPPMPSFQAAWAEAITAQADNRLWELTEEINAFLNRPTDPRNWPGICDTCGSKRVGEATYCQRCGTRILEGSRRCRVTGCPNESNRRGDCPPRLPTPPDGSIPHP